MKKPDGFKPKLHTVRQNVPTGRGPGVRRNQPFSAFFALARARTPPSQKPSAKGHADQNRERQHDVEQDFADESRQGARASSGQSSPVVRSCSTSASRSRVTYRCNSPR